LIANAIYQRETFGAIDGLCGQIDEILGVSLKVVQSTAFGEYFNQAAARQVRLVLQIREQIWQLDICLINRCEAGRGCFLSFNASLANCYIRDAELGAGFGDGRAIQNGFCTVLDELGVVEFYPVRSLVFYSVPQRFEIVAFQNGFTCTDRHAFICILDIQFSGQFAQYVLDPGFLFGEAFGQF